MKAAEIEAGIEKQRGMAPEFAAQLAQRLALMESQFAPFILPVTPAMAMPEAGKDAGQAARLNE